MVAGILNYHVRHPNLLSAPPMNPFWHFGDAPHFRSTISGLADILIADWLLENFSLSDWLASFNIRIPFVPLGKLLVNMIFWVTLHATMLVSWLVG